MINRNIVTHSFLATALTFSITAKGQAAIPTPVVDPDTVEMTPGPLSPIFPDPLTNDSLGNQNTAVLVEGVTVNLTGNEDFSQAYQVCFEFGTYLEVFDANRNNVEAPCRSELNFATLTDENPEFLGDFQEAGYAGGGLVFSDVSLTVEIANGLLTALNNTLMSGGLEIRRVLGTNILPGQLGETENAAPEFAIPYAVNGTEVTYFGLSYSISSGVVYHK